MIHKHLLDNGIRVLAERIPSVKSVAIGLWVNIGSRDEKPTEHGMSHFLEHMFFKGTKRRSAKEIALEIDSIGGEMNAFTSREMTTFYVKVLDEHLPEAIDILSDNFLYSQFDPEEIEKEQQVVLEEIKMVEDDPEDLVHELHLKDMWKGNALARPILGTPESVSSFTQRKILKFIARTYDPHKMVISVAGRFDQDPLMKRLQDTFGQYSAYECDIKARRPAKIKSSVLIKEKDFEQVHLCIGSGGLAQADPDRYVLYLLSTILGGGMSSRLFQEVRENRGWAYSIYSSPSSYQNEGLFTVYAGTSPQNAPKVVDVILEELKGIKDLAVDHAELSRAKNHIKGSMILGMESTSNRMSRLAKEELYFGRNFSMREVTQEINRVTSKQIQTLANKLFTPKTLTLTALGRIEAGAFPNKLTV